MLKFYLLAAAFLFGISIFLTPVISLDCSACAPGDCYCNVIECPNGTVSVYTTLCTGIPAEKLAFTNNSLTWSNAQAMTYYFQIYCDSGNISNCTKVDLSSFVTTTTTTTIPQETTCPYDCCVGETNYIDKYCPEGYDCVNNQCIGSSTTETTTSSQGFQINYSIVGILAIVIIAAIFVFYFFKGRKPEDSWSTLYKKYGRK